MAGLKRILVPVDFSTDSEAAADYACALARADSAEATLLHVLPPIDFSYAMTQPVGRRYEELHESRLAAAREALERLPGQFARRVLREGDAAEAILSVAAEWPADAIVLSTRGAGALRRWLLVGSVTAKLLAGAECPVWTGLRWPRTPGPLEIGRIACAIDLGSQTEQVLCAARGLASRFGARVTVVHARAALRESAADFLDDHARVTMRARIEDRIGQLLEKASLDADVMVESGSPAGSVAHAARVCNADLLVVGRGAAHDLLGKLRAHAYEIIRRSPCPVVGV